MIHSIFHSIAWALKKDYDDDLMGDHLQFENALTDTSASDTFPYSSIRLEQDSSLQAPIWLHFYFPATLSSHFAMFMSVSPTSLLSSMRSGTMTLMLPIASYVSGTMFNKYL